MAFCNSCGTAMEAGTKFCPKCGAAAMATAASAAPAASTAPVAPTQGSGALKIILIVLAVVVGLGILGMGTCAFMVRRAFNTHRDRDGSVHVETPFGTVDSNQDPNEAARNLGVDLYPGATVAKEGSANMTIGKMHTATVTLETNDPPSTVNDFYKSKYPNATVMSSQGDHYNIMSGNNNDMTTINIDKRDGQTRIHIARVTGMAGTSSN